MEDNRIYNLDFMSNGLPDHCADLIIADPPYYRVKGDFDSVWGSFGDYLKDVERWAQGAALPAMWRHRWGGDTSATR